VASGEICICLVSSEHMPYGAAMVPFVLNIIAPRRTAAYLEPFGTFVLINSELRRKQGTTDEECQDDIIGFTEDHDSGDKSLTIGQNHGIRDENISSGMKKAFKLVMPEIIEMFPGMANPFVGHIKFHVVERRLREVHFLL